MNFSHFFPSQGNDGRESFICFTLKDTMREITLIISLIDFLSLSTFLSPSFSNPPRKHKVKHQYHTYTSVTINMQRRKNLSNTTIYTNVYMVIS